MSILLLLLLLCIVSEFLTCRADLSFFLVFDLIYVDWILAAARGVNILDIPAVTATGDVESTAGAPDVPPKKLPRTTLFASYHKQPSSAHKSISLPTVISSYLAYIQLILDRTEAGTHWNLVRDNAQFVCLRPLFESVFCTP